MIDGFLAHEVMDIVPQAVTGLKDEIDENDDPKYQGMDNSKLVPLLVQAVKELSARIEELESKWKTTQSGRKIRSGLQRKL